MPIKNLSKEIQAERDRIDDYLASVKGLYAFAESVCWNEQTRSRLPDSQIGIPRKMNSAVNGKDLTPDAVVQKNATYGVVAEMKKHFKTSDEKYFDQIKRYDKDLKGWWSEDEMIQKHDLVLLTHIISSADAKDVYNEWIQKGNSFDRKFAIIEFSSTETGKEFFFLRKAEGQLSDQEHDGQLRKGKPIPEEILVRIMEKYKFYDAEPPLIHMLLLLHNYIFPTIASQYDFEGESGKKYPAIEITVHEAVKLLHDHFCPPQDNTRQALLPKPEWVESALDTFVEMNLAVKDKETAKYKVVLKKPRKKDVVEYLVSKLSVLKQEKETVTNAQQTSLFEKN